MIFAIQPHDQIGTLPRRTFRAVHLSPRVEHISSALIANSSESETFASEFISPSELAKRWRCGRSSVDRIARRAGFTRVCLGEGKNGMIRYLRKEVVKYEASRSIVMQ